MRGLRFQGLRWSALLITLTLVLTACGSATQPAAPKAAEPAKKDAPAVASAPSQPAPAPVAKPSPPKELKKIKVIYTIENLIFAPLYAAMEKGFFKEEGLDAEIIQMSGGDATAALVAGSVDYVAGNGNAVTTTAAKNVGDVIAIGNMVRLSTAITVLRKELMAEKKLRADMPIADRLKGLKGVTFGVLNPGSADDNMFKMYMEQGGMRAGVDAKVVGVGSGANMVAGMSKKQIDGFMASPTTPNQAVDEGFAEILILGGEVAGTRDISWDAFATRKSVIAKDEATVKSVARALAKGQNYVRDAKNKAGTMEILTKRFSKVKPALIAAGLDYMIKADAWPEDMKMTEAIWKNQLGLDKKAGSIKADVNLDTKEGGIWTNKFATSK